jgi:hypothetical protein
LVRGVRYGAGFALGKITELPISAQNLSILLSIDCKFIAQAFAATRDVWLSKLHLLHHIEVARHSTAHPL